MNKRRLLKLADLLEADAKNKKGIKFDFSMWGLVDDSDYPASCGTTACAMGLAAVSGAFKRQGLKCSIAGGTINIGFGREWDALRAAQRLFDISHWDAKKLFVDSYDLLNVTGAKAEREVAKRIRDFVADA